MRPPPGVDPGPHRGCSVYLHGRLLEADEPRRIPWDGVGEEARMNPCQGEAMRPCRTCDAFEKCVRKAPEKGCYVPPMRAFRVEDREGIWHGALVRARTPGAARFDYARDLREISGDMAWSEILPRLRVRRDRSADPFPSAMRDAWVNGGDRFCGGRIPTDGDGQSVRSDQAELDAAAFNAAHPVGTPVRYWTGARSGKPKLGRLRVPASTIGGPSSDLPGHTAVAWIEGCASCVALTHVEVISPEELEFAAGFQRGLETGSSGDPALDALMRIPAPAAPPDRT